MGLEPKSHRLIPVKSKIPWETGNIFNALDAGAQEAFSVDLMDISQIEWVTSKRYMALHHQVSPAELAHTTCTTCHAKLGD